jgi:HprK-related kinase B
VPDFRVVAVEGPEPDVTLPLAVKPPEPGKRRSKEEWVDLPGGRFVRKLRTGVVFVFGSGVHVAYGPCRANANQIVNFVNNRYMQWRLQQGYLLAHAGAVARDGLGLAMCGDSGAGKSTAALDLVARGLDFVSNDRALLRPDRGGGVELLGIPKHPRVNPGTIVYNEALHDLLPAGEREELASLPRDRLRTLEDKYDVLVHEVFGPGRFRLRARLAALVVIAWDGEGEARLRRVELERRPDLLERVMKSPGLFYEPEEEPDFDLEAERYVEVLSRRPAWEITGTRDFDRAAELCARVLDGGGEA